MDPKSLYLHSHGQPVRALQFLLKRYEAGLTLDGKFGPRTEHAVRTAQRKLAISPVDGIAGPHTLATLAEAAKAGQPPAPNPAPAAAPSFGARLNTMGRKAGAAVANIEHAAVDTLEEAIQAVESWIAGQHPHPPYVPAQVRPVVQQGKPKAQKQPAPPGLLRDPKVMTLSEDGRKFVFFHEAGDGRVTAHLHHPKGRSGVTLGPGYDMRDRKPSDIVADLEAIQVDHATAVAAAKGAGLDKEPADAFAKANKDLLKLSTAQQAQLQRTYEPHYERMVARAIHIPLHQYEFDALVSFAGNPQSATIWHTTTRLVNEHQPHQAMAEIFLATNTGEASMKQGLVNRRTAESHLFLFGDYSYGR